jgi:hypothetical protein
VSKYEFEWTDEQARAVQRQLCNENEMDLNWHASLLDVAKNIEKQKPVPLPSKLAAVVQTLMGVWLRTEPTGKRPWRLVDHNIWYSDDELRQQKFEILSEGVDL